MTEKMTDAEIDEFIAIAVEYENPSCADVVAQLRAERDVARAEFAALQIKLNETERGSKIMGAIGVGICFAICIERILGWHF